MNPLKKNEFEYVIESLYYWKMEELKEFCLQNEIPKTGKKGEIIDRIKHYILSGKILKQKPLPSNSIAKPGVNYSLKLETKILKGAYKNDLKTRLFFKKIIGEHFHFTAFGIDWISERWQKGTPPTYAEFAKMWEKEYESRLQKKANPKQEWAYLTFLKNYQEKNPRSTKEERVSAWEIVRKERFIKSKKLLDKIK